MGRTSTIFLIVLLSAGRVATAQGSAGAAKAPNLWLSAGSAELRR